MTRSYPSITALLLGMLTVACGPGSDDPGVSSAHPSPALPSSDVTPVDWVEVEAIDVEAFNADMEPGKLTLDVGVAEFEQRCVTARAYVRKDAGDSLLHIRLAFAFLR